MTIHLAEPEAKALEGFCRRQLRWDGRLPARIVTTDKALGMFTAPPIGVLAFVAVPASSVADQAPLDVTVSLAHWADMLRDVGTGDVTPDQLPLAAASSMPVTSGPSVRHLPPSEGWQVPMFAVSGDLVPVVDLATEEFESRSADRAPREQEAIAEQIWGRPAWAGLPMRALHAARQLGMLTKDSTRVSAATCGPWKRLNTNRGQVFVHATGPAARLSLHVVR